MNKEKGQEHVVLSIKPNQSPKRLVMVAVDGSAHCAHTISWAMKSFLSSNDEVIVISVIEDAYATQDQDVMRHIEEMQQLQVDKRSKFINAIVVQLLQDGMNATVSILVSKSPRDAIIDAAVSHKADILLLGSRGDGLLSKLLLGSVAQYVSQHAPLPVLIVRSDAHLPGSEPPVDERDVDVEQFAHVLDAQKR